MFKYLFQAMNEKLNGILATLPAAHDKKRRETLERELRELREMSDGIIEEWLLFEEKLVNAMKHYLPPLGAPESETQEASLHYQRGEGYFKLAMFAEAAREFAQVASEVPEYLQARYYLSLCLLQEKKMSDALKELLSLIAMAEDGKLKAAAYNALGCIQAMLGDVKSACDSFRASHALDPNFEDPIYNLKACQIEGGVLQLGVAIG